MMYLNFPLHKNEEITNERQEELAVTPSMMRASIVDSPFSSGLPPGPTAHNTFHLAT